MKINGGMRCLGLREALEFKRKSKSGPEPTTFSSKAKSIPLASPEPAIPWLPFWPSHIKDEGGIIISN